MGETAPEDMVALLECAELTSLRERKPAACAAWVEAHYRGVHAFFWWLTRDAETAADLTQETFLAFWDSLARLDPAADPDLKAWLYGIARNRWRKRCRDAREATTALEEALEVPDATPGPEERLVGRLEADGVARGLAALPAEYREVLVLRVFQELSYAQIAEALGISAGLARWRAHQGRLRLHAVLAEGPREGEEA
jgi:RNA polymerase sigma-70 factor (ECF subfamily)